MIFVLSAFFRPLWDEDLTWVCWCCKKNLFWFFNSPTASILILRTHNPVTTKGDHQWVLQRLFLVEPSSRLAISELFPFSFCFLYPAQNLVKGMIDWKRSGSSIQGWNIFSDCTRYTEALQWLTLLLGISWLSFLCFCQFYWSLLKIPMEFLSERHLHSKRADLRAADPRAPRAE